MNERLIVVGDLFAGGASRQLAFLLFTTLPCDAVDCRYTVTLLGITGQVTFARWYIAHLVFQVVLCDSCCVDTMPFMFLVYDSIVFEPSILLCIVLLP